MKFDFIIIGGGMVGAAMALALRSPDVKVALVDASPLQPSEDHRLIALNYSSVCLFKNLGVWPALAPHASPIHEVHVSHRGHFGVTRLRAAEMNLDALGYVVPAKYINAALYENLTDITLFRPATLTQLTQTPDEVRIVIETGEGIKNLSAPVMIGADGTHSTVRDLLNISTEKTDYEQSALVTQTYLSRPHQNVAYERFQKMGAIAMLPLVDNQTATIWTTSNDEITHLMQLTDDAFLQILQKQFGYRLGRFIKIGKRFTYPLQMIKAKQKIKDRVILIGNAAHTLHPIAAQGLNLALYEIAELKDHLSTSFSGTLDSFSMHQEKITSGVSHHLTWLFSNDFFILKTARQVGMLSLDLCQSLKHRLTHKLIGQTGNRPTLFKERMAHETQSPDY